MHLDINFYTADVVMNPCRQCVAPSCAAACPADAYYYDDERGCLVTDKEKCLGCGACAQACPVSAISYNRHLKKSSKCDLCGLCTRYCAADVLRIVEITKTGKEKQPALKEG
jgi:Fe-S-cluster-containing dehydrogenase component